MAEVVKRAYKYRFYPTTVQAAELQRTFGCVRKVYNLALQARTAAWYGERCRVTYVQTSALLTGWKGGVPERGLVGSAAAGPAAPAGRVRRVLGQAGSLPQIQVSQEIAQSRRVHTVGVPVLTTRLGRENQAVVIEDLNVVGMLGNHSLARAITGGGMV